MKSPNTQEAGERTQHTPVPWKISRPGYMPDTTVVHGDQLGDGSTNDVAYCVGPNREAN